MKATLFTIVLWLFGYCAVQAALINGSFEEGLGGWSVSGAVDVVQYNSSSGTNSARLNAHEAAPSAVLSQSFTSSPGENYTVRFDFGAWSEMGNSQQKVLVEVTGKGTVLSNVVTADGVMNTIKMNPQIFYFVADAASTTLTFRDVSEQTASTDGHLDNVSVNVTRLEDGLVGYYALDGDANDRSGNGYNGVNTGVTFESAKFGLGAKYDGNSAHHIRVDGFREIRSNLTVCAWFRAEGWLGPYGNALVECGQYNDAYSLFVNKNYVRTEMNGNTGYFLRYEVPMAEISDSNFHNAAFVKDQDKGKVRVYFDGVLIGEATYTNALYSQTEPLYLGTSFPGGVDSNTGLLDEVRIYNRALSGTEILKLFNPAFDSQLHIEVSQVRLCWNVASNTTSQLQYRSELTGGAWVDLGLPIVGYGTNVCTTDDVSGPQRFYRVIPVP